MTSMLTNNPYRILGVFSNSPKKDVLSNLNKMKAFLKVGKTISFPLDLPLFLPSIERDEAIVSSAQTSIELPMDRIITAMKKMFGFPYLFPLFLSIFPLFWVSSMYAEGWVNKYGKSLGKIKICMI